MILRRTIGTVAGLLTDYCVKLNMLGLNLAGVNTIVKEGTYRDRESLFTMTTFLFLI